MTECSKNCAACSQSCPAENSGATDPWLERLDATVSELHRKGNFCCSQTVLAIGMKRLGINNPDLLRAMAGFCGGACAGVCGALAGGEALIGLYIGRGTPASPRDLRQKPLADALTETFRAYWKSTQCDDLVHGDDKLRRYTCPSLIAGTLEMVWGILRENGIDIDSRETR